MLNEKQFINKLTKIKVALFDLDGTIYIEDSVIEGSIEGLSRLRERNVKVVFLTNNSSRTTAEYINKLKGMGLFCSGDEVLTSARATADYLLTEKLASRVYCFGTAAVKQELVDLGIEIVENDPKVALLLYNKDINYSNICKFNEYISKGVHYVAGQSDNVCPSADVYLPDCGSFIEMFAVSSGKRPQTVVGKPNVYMGETIKKTYNVLPQEVMMVGDRLYTDVRFGKNCGFLTVLVTSGETSKSDLQTSVDQPDFCVDNVFELTDYLKK